MATRFEAQETLRTLFDTLQGRHRPEDVVRLVLAAYPALGRRERWKLRRTVWSGFAYSLMPTTFEAPAGLARPLGVLAELLELPRLSEVEARDPDRVRALLGRARPVIGMSEGQTDFMAHRRHREERQAHGLTLSRRRYNKLFRLIGRLEQYTADLERQQTLAWLGRVAKTSFAGDLLWEDFSADPDTACFVAYMTANLGRRSVFTNGPQARAFDDVAAMLFGRCENSATANWFAVAHVFPRRDVLDRLSAEQRLRLLGHALKVLHDASVLLRWTWEQSDINLETMIVRRGNDSSTWNTLAGAWNRARDYWIALLQAMGHDATFDVFLPGKVMRLMAADVAAWHRATAGDVHDDTAVWAALPKPWEVLSGEATCTRELIEQTCRQYGIDPERSGWTAARPRTAVAAWEPTYDLVHGIGVSDPELATVLRRIGVFSGKRLRLDRLGEPVGSSDAR